jgi:hypothetical protein
MTTMWFVTLNTVSRLLAAQIIVVSNVEALLFQYRDKKNIFFSIFTPQNNTDSSKRSLVHRE